MSQNIIAVCTPARNVWVLISPSAYQQWTVSIFNIFQSSRQRIDSHCPFRWHSFDCPWDWVRWEVLSWGIKQWDFCSGSSLGLPRGPLIRTGLGRLLWEGGWSGGCCCSPLRRYFTSDLCSPTSTSHLELGPSPASHVFSCASHPFTDVICRAAHTSRVWSKSPSSMFPSPKPILSPVSLT